MTLARLSLLSLLIVCDVLPEAVCASDSESRSSAPEGPLFTGTLLSTRARTVEPGHWVVQPYFYSTRFGGLYNNNWRLQSAAVTRTNIQQTYLMYGLTSRIDIEVAETRRSSSGWWRPSTYLSKLGASMPALPMSFLPHDHGPAVD